MRRALNGLTASKGLTLGRARVRHPHALTVNEERIDADRIEDELARLHAALAATRLELDLLHGQLQGALSQELGEFLDLHALLLDDPELLNGIEELIRGGPFSADYALRLQRDRLASVFEGMDDPYFRSRLEDLDHVVGRVHAALHRRDDDAASGLSGEILVTNTVAPSEIAQLQLQGVVAVVTTGGSPLSHAAILARSLHLPLLVGAHEALAVVDDGDALMLDAGAGELIAEPDAADLREFHRRRRAVSREHKQLLRLRHKPTETRDGASIQLFANAESDEDIREAHALGAAGIGLYRTEFLYLQGDAPPDEEAQFLLYRDLVLAMGGRPVTIRSLDLGSDKADRQGIVVRGEPNPALGLRGLRLCLARPEMFRAQIRAVLRAGAYGPVKLLLPMVSCREEILLTQHLIAEEVAGLQAEGKPAHPDLPLGAMIEVPAAALSLPGFIGLLDFVSIGTNDLVQYLLAADRNNDAVGDLYSPLHPAVLRLLHQLIALGKRRRVPVTVCGEIAGDPTYTRLLLALGLTDFSLHPGTLLEVRQAVRDAHLAELRAGASRLLRARDREAIGRWMASVA